MFTIAATPFSSGHPHDAVSQVSESRLPRDILPNRVEAGRVNNCPHSFANPPVSESSSAKCLSGRGAGDPEQVAEKAIHFLKGRHLGDLLRRHCIAFCSDLYQSGIQDSWRG